MSKALRLLQITARHQDFPFLTVFSIIKTFSKISRLCWRKKAPVNDFVRFPVPRIIAEVKQVMGSFRCYDNSGVIAALMMTNCHLNTTVVAIFPNVCLRRRSLCSDLALTLENCIEPPSQDGLCCCDMALISFRLFLKNLGNLKDIFGQMVYRPPWQKISRTPMAKMIMITSGQHSLTKGFFSQIKLVCFVFPFRTRGQDWGNKTYKF